jgi:FtsH-binding integral membrane protein
MAATNETAGRSKYALPLVIAVTGHRDLVDTEVPEIRERVGRLLRDLAKRYPERPITIMSPLAAGADMLVAEEALKLGLDLVAPLPMPRDLYLDDFDTSDERDRFNSLLQQASEFFELPLAPGNSIDGIKSQGLERSRQYAQLGIFLCAHCHILLALWDGKQTNDLGGTAQVVQFHHDDIMPGYTTTTVATQQMLVDDESDLIYHIVCSRNRENGEPNADLQALECWWFTKDKKNPRSEELPKQHQMVFERGGEFSADAIRFAEQIESEKYPLLDDADKDELSPGLGAINHIFCIADWLAIHYQKRMLLALRATHVFAFLMGLMFILYSDLKTWQYFMMAFLVFFLMAAATQYTSKRGSWHRKYLDYRALAEGLRVQYYWAAAGVTNENESKFTHDNFLQTQDPELGWIRNVMRVAGTRCDAAPFTEARGLTYVLREWIGNKDSGQLGYFRTKAADRIKKNKITERLALLSLLTSAVAVTLIIVIGESMSDGLRDPLMAAMGSMLLLVAIRQGYAYSTAEKELIKQYEFMLRIFYNASRRLDDTSTDSERRQIIRALGGSALDEHAEWILMHRDRSLDQGEIWRMGS